MSIGKKEMGLAVKALAQYASDCLGNGDYIEMNRTFKIALNMANMYELKEAEWVKDTACAYINDTLDELRDTIAEGKEAQEIYNKLIS